MLQHQIVQSPARLGLTNPNSPSPSLQNPTPPPKFPTTTAQPPPQQQQQQPPQTPSSSSATTTSAALLSLLPPLPRAQSLLLQMSSLSTKLFELSPNKSLWLSAFRGTLPTFLSHQPQGAPPPPLEYSPNTPKEILSLFTSLQTQLFEAVAEIQEINDLQNPKQRLARDIHAKDMCLLNFANKLKEAEKVLDVLVDDYSDYRRLNKRAKLEESEKNAETENGTTVSSRLKLADILSYAHRISYTTFAPPEFGAGQAPLRGALPPAPQEEQMRASQLYNFADLDVGLPKDVEIKEKIIEPMIEPPPPPMVAPAGNLAGLNITVPMGWKPGMPVELPKDLPLPPPGWKPGDPLPPLESVSVPRVVEQQVVANQGLLHKAPEPIQVRHVQIDILDQDDDSSDYTSDEGSSDDED